jgi:hypothetical protein
MAHAFVWIQEILKIIQVTEIYQVNEITFILFIKISYFDLKIEYNVEVVDDQVIVVGFKQDLEKVERSKIPDDLEIEAKPVVAVVGGGAGEYLFS